MSDTGRALCGDAMCEVADRMNRSGQAAELTARATGRRCWLQLLIEHGLRAGNRWTDVREPVRTRSMLGSWWRDVQRSRGRREHRTFLDERPDLR